MWYTFSMKPVFYLLAAIVVLALGFFVLFRNPVIAPGPASSKDGSIIIESPQSGSTIYSPLIVTGRAKGKWYFEASFPFYVTNSSGAIIGQGIIQAQSDWMSPNLVPFRGEVKFPQQPSGSSGHLVFKNDNPSGLTENQYSFSVPIKF